MSCFDFRTMRFASACFVLAATLSAGGRTLRSARADATAADADRVAAAMTQSAQLPGGMCAVLGSADGRLAVALARQGSFYVHLLASDANQLDRLQTTIHQEGLGSSMAAALMPPGCLPYADNLLNLVVIHYERDSAAALPPAKEIMRVLAPLGTVWIGSSEATSARASWTEQLAAELKQAGAAEVEQRNNGGLWVHAAKPWPRGIDEWTHYLHGADGNPVAQDEVVGPPEHFQWIGKPLWMRSHETDSSLSTIVTAGGRLFYIVDEGPIGLAGPHPLPDKWSLAARDAFNGKLLWKVPIRRWGWREWKNTWFTNRPGDFPLNIRKRLVATSDYVYVTLGYRAPVSQLDARTGQILQTYSGTEGTGEILHVDGTLVLAVMDQQHGGRVAAVDADSGRIKWSSEKVYRGTTVDYIRLTSRYATLKPFPLDPALNIATDGQSVALIDGAELVCLDFQTGAERWRRPFPADERDENAGGIRAQGNLWNGTMIVRDGVVLHASPFKLAALSAKDGKLLWSQPKEYIGHLWYEWKDVFVIDSVAWTWGAELDSGTFRKSARQIQRARWPTTINGYDLHSGRLVKKVPLGPIFRANHHHRCYRNKATVNYVLASRRGTEYVDLRQGRHSVHNWVRGTCHVGMMPANGLQYATPHPCRCYIDEKLNGLLALAPAGKSAGCDHRSDPAQRLVKGPAFSRPLRDASPRADDWPTFRHDPMRSGAVATEVPDPLGVAWRVSAGGKLSAPVVADGKVLVARVDDHQLLCLDAQDGRRLWQVTTGARIDSPPTWWRGSVLFGARDGWVWCVDAEDGAVRWRFRAAPAERLVGAFGQLESAWPVHGSVLVQHGVAYVVAGRSSQLDGGLYLYGLDAATGQLRCQNRLQGPDYQIDESGQKLVVEGKSKQTAGYEENFKLPMGALPDIMMSDGKTIFMRTVALDSQLQPAPGTPPMQPTHGFLDDTYFKRTPWTFRNASNYGRLLVYDKRQVYFVRQFDTLRGLDPTVYFTPGSKGYLLFAQPVGGKSRSWMERIPVRIRAMALTSGRLLVAGPPDVIDPRDPLGAFEGRKGGWLYVIDSASGQKRSEYQLDSPPVFNGIAAARSCVYLTDEGGNIICLK